MRRLLTLTLAFSLFSAVCSCPAADKPAPTQSSGSATPTTPDIKPIAGDEYADAVLQLYDLARCGCVCCCPHPGTQQPVSSCVGSRLVCRLNAIDTIGGFVKSQTAVLCLSHLLKEQCCLCASSPSGGDIESVLVALHAINALKNIGANAKSALVAINCACCISPDLTSAISAGADDNFSAAKATDTVPVEDAGAGERCREKSTRRSQRRVDRSCEGARSSTAQSGFGQSNH